MRDDGSRMHFVKSVDDAKDLPPSRAEVAVVGRSNVGKSSLVNALGGRKELAQVSKTPGRTRLLNLLRGRTAASHPRRLPRLRVRAGVEGGPQCVAEDDGALPAAAGGAQR